MACKGSGVTHRSLLIRFIQPPRALNGLMQLIQVPPKETSLGITR
jgi:hypothetical protein